MKVTVCELTNDPRTLADDWQALCSHVREAGSDLVLLPEMAFVPWMGVSNQVDPAVWKSAVKTSERWLARLGELVPAAVVAGTRPILCGEKRLNQGFVFEPALGLRGVHEKYYLPDEDGFWEASWYERGSGEFEWIDTRRGRAGFMICTEIWFFNHARAFSKQGVELLLCPRACPSGISVDKWVAGGRAAAVVSGAFCLSSNFRGATGPVSWGGAGWVIEPLEGVVLGLTSPDRPFLTVEIDLATVAKARQTYPRYVKE